MPSDGDRLNCPIKTPIFSYQHASTGSHAPPLTIQPAKRVDDTQLASESLDSVVTILLTIKIEIQRLCHVADIAVGTGCK